MPETYPDTVLEADGFFAEEDFFYIDYEESKSDFGFASLDPKNPGPQAVPVGASTVSFTSNDENPTKLNSSLPHSSIIPTPWLDNNSYLEVPRFNVAPVPRFEIPPFRRNVSYVGKSEGFDLVTPDLEDASVPDSPEVSAPPLDFTRQTNEDEKKFDSMFPPFFNQTSSKDEATATSSKQERSPTLLAASFPPAHISFLSPVKEETPSMTSSSTSSSSSANTPTTFGSSSGFTAFSQPSSFPSSSPFTPVGSFDAGTPSALLSPLFDGPTPSDGPPPLQEVLKHRDDILEGIHKDLTTLSFSKLETSPAEEGDDAEVSDTEEDNGSVDNDDKNAKPRRRGRARRSRAPVVLDVVRDLNVSARALSDRPSDLYNTENDDMITIGQYTKAVRRAKILRYKQKKQMRPSERKVLYKCRKRFAENRPRIGGRFVKMKNSPDGPAGPDTSEISPADITALPSLAALDLSVPESTLSMTLTPPAQIDLTTLAPPIAALA